MARDESRTTRNPPEDHPDPGAYFLATDILLGAFKAVGGKDRADIEEAARFLSDDSKDGLLHFWLYLQSAKDPQGSHRLTVCKQIGHKITQTLTQTKAQLRHKKIPDQKEYDQHFVALFHKLKDIPELESLCQL